MRTDESTTTAGIGDVVLQIVERVRHGHTALAKKLLELREGQPGETGGASYGQLPLAIESDRQLKMKLSFGFLASCLQTRGEIVRYVQSQTHALTLMSCSAMATKG